MQENDARNSESTSLERYTMEEVARSEPAGVFDWMAAGKLGVSTGFKVAEKIAERASRFPLQVAVLDSKTTQGICGIHIGLFNRTAEGVYIESFAVTMPREAGATLFEGPKNGITIGGSRANEQAPKRLPMRLAPLETIALEFKYPFSRNSDPKKFQFGIAELQFSVLSHTKPSTVEFNFRVRPEA